MSIYPGPVNRLPSLLPAAVDASIVGPEERHKADMKELMFMGNEVKNSWGTFATPNGSSRRIPKWMAGFARMATGGQSF